MRSPQVHIRLPEDAKKWLLVEAKRNERTVNAQVVFMVKNEMKKAEESQLGGTNSSASQ